MAHRHFVDTVFIARIDLLRGAEQGCDFGLRQVVILPQAAEDLIIRFDLYHHRFGFLSVSYPHQIGCIDFTPEIVYPVFRMLFRALVIQPGGRQHSLWLCSGNGI